MYKGAVIFEGSYKGKSPDEFTAALEESLNSNPMNDEVCYLVMKNEVYPKIDGSMEQMALDSLLGSSPAVVVVPKSWKTPLNAVLEDSNRMFWRNLLSPLSVLSTVYFAVNCFDLFNPNGAFITTGVLPDDFVPMALTPLLILQSSTLVETLLGRLRGFGTFMNRIITFSGGYL